jgi:uncharacterized protein
MNDPVELIVRKAQPCPICKKLAEPAKVNTASPFCSKRCAAIDLGRWLNGSYAIPVEDDEAERAPINGTEED